ncbi:hypothetical protein [Nonomuraea typhae]|uniref:Uncharacterized protein n=1 Tax=Nonomuraea typhae TaxID=2603600 RepID=A0ABW7ZAS4_9ACTN
MEGLRNLRGQTELLFDIGPGEQPVFTDTGDDFEEVVKERVLVRGFCE